MKKLTVFGEHLHALRTNATLSEKDLSKSVGKSQSYISAIEDKEIPLLKFDFIKACMDAFELKGYERHEFLVKAMSCSQRMSIPLKDISIVPQERFLHLFACILLNENPSFHNPNRKWIEKCLKQISDIPPNKVEDNKPKETEANGGSKDDTPL